jgi:head-tail adaptor
MKAAGIFRHRVRIERFDYVIDSDGSAVQDQQTGEVHQDWIVVDRVWASIEPVSVKDFIQSAAAQSQVVARITIRARDDLDITHRLVHERDTQEVIYYPLGFLRDANSGKEHITIPVKEGARV